MQELYTLISTSHPFIQVLVLLLALIGCYVLYRFKTIVMIVAGGAIALWLSLKGGKK